MANHSLLDLDRLPGLNKGSASEIARAGKAIFNVPGTGFSIGADVIGVEIKAAQEPAAQANSGSPAETRMRPRWRVLVGRHWLLGSFKVDLAHRESSVGSTSNDAEADLQPGSDNKDRALYNLNFRKFPKINLAGTARPRAIRFRKFDAEPLPEANVLTRLVSLDRVGLKYRVNIRIRNLTDEHAEFAYFNAIRSSGLMPRRDYGFISLPARGETIVRFTMESAFGDHQVDVPFFVALYKPRRLRGTQSVVVRYTF